MYEGQCGPVCPACGDVLRRCCQILAEIDFATDYAADGVADVAAAVQEAPALHAELRPGGVFEIQADGLAEIQVRLYRVDLEMLFSRTPFLRGSGAQPDFSFVKPVFEGSIPGDAKTWELPEGHRQSDLAVELTAGALRVFTMYFACTLRVAVAEQHGYLTVTSADRRPMPAVYVKVFARVNGQEQFFKDGYTDLRGRFDYASLSSESAASVQRFALLVLSPGAGGLVREAAAPGGY